MPEDTDRQWDNYWEVYWAKRSRRWHDPIPAAHMEATIYCRKHGLPIPHEQDFE
ncbi:hypothetical protein GGP77_001605 [Salinibacter ruber]|nr:hypothetical protein [Salinibacter ruber]